jgi:hypothetical protein
MSGIEERLARDIAAVTGGVVVTDSDLREARIAVAERVESERGQDRLRRLAPVAAAAAVLALVGATAYLTLGRDDESAGRPADQGPVTSDPNADYLVGSAPTAQLLSGVWRLDNGHVVVKFTVGGDVRFDDRGTLFSRPSTTGTYALSGQAITVTVTGNPQSRCIGTTFTLRGSVPAAGELRYVPDVPDQTCSPLPVGRGAFEQALPPNNKDLRELAFSHDAGWQALASKDTLYGVWLAEGGGFLLEIDRSGAYFVADASGEPVDTGRWSVRGADLTLTSSAGSSSCAAGDRLVLGAVEWVQPSTTAFRGTVRANTCNAAWTPAAWALIPSATS